MISLSSAELNYLAKCSDSDQTPPKKGGKHNNNTGNNKENIVNKGNTKNDHDYLPELPPHRHNVNINKNIHNSKHIKNRVFGNNIKNTIKLNNNNNDKNSNINSNINNNNFIVNNSKVTALLKNINFNNTTRNVNINTPRFHNSLFYTVPVSNNINNSTQLTQQQPNTIFGTNNTGNFNKNIDYNSLLNSISNIKLPFNINTLNMMNNYQNTIFNPINIQSYYKPTNKPSSIYTIYIRIKMFSTKLIIIYITHQKYRN